MDPRLHRDCWVSTHPLLLLGNSTLQFLSPSALLFPWLPPSPEGKDSTPVFQPLCLKLFLGLFGIRAVLCCRSS